MFDELVKQVKRLFSSKSNGSKLVYSLPNKFHFYMQVLLALSIILLMGYSKFRIHFYCQGIGTIDPKVTTVFCWLNGTTTYDVRDDHKYSYRSHITGAPQNIPHVGMSFKSNKETGKYELINHSYMHHIWALLILMAICSFLAQRQWSSIFNNDLMRAILQLPGSEELDLVKKAQAAKGYQTLTELEKERSEHLRRKFTVRMNKVEQLEHSIKMLEGEQNIHNRTLDYYPNQLIYLLLAARPPAYQFPSRSLSKKLIWYSTISFSFTCLQFILPWMFIGPKYTLYGLYFARAGLSYLLKQLFRPSANVNSFDYTLSSRIWPISTQCQYLQYGLGQEEEVTVQCTASINEISAKLFAMIWWVVAIHILIELYALMWIVISCISFSITDFYLGRTAWPKTRNEARQLAKFRYRREEILARQIRKSNFQEVTLANLESNDGDKKQLEAEADRSISKSSQRRSKKWYLWCTRDIGIFLSRHWKRIIAPDDDSTMKSKAKGRGCKKSFNKERKEDPNILYLLYLLYLRLNRSKKNTEQIIRMTSAALTIYLDMISSSKVDQTVIAQTTEEDNVKDEAKSLLKTEQKEQENTVVPKHETAIDVMI